MKYIHSITRYQGGNNKAKEICQYVELFDRVLFQTEADFQDFKEELETKVFHLNEFYPRSREVEILYYDTSIHIRPKGALDKAVCIIHHTDVMGQYNRRRCS